MGRIAVALGGACAALALCCSAAANVIVGINDDAKYEAANPAFFMPTMASVGLRINALTIRWDETQTAPLDPDLQAFIEQVISSAQANGVTVELDLYPLHSQVFTGGLRCSPSASPTACGDTAKIQQFAAWAATIAQIFPGVHQFIVMNECNQPLFLNPQWNAGGQNQSAAICGRALAAAYDALKTVSSSNFVWGVGLSPRGNDSPNAPSNSSTSPVRFLGYLGAWFKAFAAATHRTTPLMDGLDFHPYPVPQSLPFATGYPDPRDAGIANLPRIYQAFWNGFNGSPQKTIGQQSGGGLPLSLNEMGIQTDERNQLSYQGTEVSANPAGGLVGASASEAYQAAYYRQMLALLACDPNVRLINIFHLVDEPNLAGWQSGLYSLTAATPAPKQSATAVSAWLAQSHGACQGPSTSWRPTTALTPPGAKAGPAKAARVKPQPPRPPKPPKHR